jgi:hypothetical protein
MRHPAWWLLAAMVAGAAWALDPPRPAPAPAPEPEQVEQAKQAEQAPAAVETAPAPAAEDGPPPASPPEARSTGPTPQRFDPSEKVRADFPVSFPIDI